MTRLINCVKKKRKILRKVKFIIGLEKSAVKMALKALVSPQVLQAIPISLYTQLMGIGLNIVHKKINAISKILITLIKK